MKKISLLLGLILLSSINCFAQETHLRNSKWFAYNKQLQFDPQSSNSSPQATANPIGYGSLASVCDQDGNPLIVVRGAGVIWANGQSIGTIPSAATTNNVIIVPKPNHLDRYYIITSSTTDGLKYTEVDLTNSTLTNVETTFNDSDGNSATALGNGVCSTVHANGTDYWIIAQTDFILTSYLVTKNGINTTPVGIYGVTSSGSTNGIKISSKTNNNGNRIASIDYNTGICLRNFNNETGEIYMDYSDGMYGPLQDIQTQKLNQGIYTADAEFSADGNTLYTVDDMMNGYGAVYTVSDSGYTSIGAYGFIASQRGPDGDVYFLDSGGNLYQEYINSIESLCDIGISLFNGNGQLQAHLPQLVSFNQCIASPPTPTFNIPAYVCKGTTVTLPIASIEGITGSWSPAFNSAATTNYTFTAAPGQCVFNTVNWTINVNDQNTVPSFNLPTSICVGSSLTFPTISSNQITGIWSPTLDNTVTTTYTFTPSLAQCGATFTSTIAITPNVVPTFDPIDPICPGDYFELSGDSTNGIYGRWTPYSRNISATTTYTYTPSYGSCGTPITMTVVVNPIIPTFNEIAITGDNNLNYVLPLTSTNTPAITGVWNPPIITEGNQTYVFTPNSGQCANPISKSILLLRSKAIEAIDDDFTVAASHSATTPSVLSNDMVNSISFAYGDATASFVSLESINGTPLWSEAECASNNPLTFTNYSSLLTSDGSYQLPYYFPGGTYLLTYTINSSLCNGSSDTGTAIIRYGRNDGSILMKKVQNQEQQQLTDTIPVYPNPSNGIFNIDLTAVKGDYDTVQVFNMLGSMVYEGRLQSKTANSIDLTNTAIGFYIAKVSGNSGSKSFQLIKQ